MTPRAFIKDAAKAALDKGQTKYTPTPCLPELKAAIAKKFNDDNSLPYAPDQITTGAGGKHCLYMAFMAVLNPGDEVIIPTPYWVSYPEQVKLAGGVNVFVPGDEANNFKITPQQLEQAITPKTKVLMMNSPSNPGGHAYTPAELKALADVVAKHPHVIVFSDEIYEKLIYDGLQFVSFATLHPSLMDRTLTFNCHSKSFAMTGWRVGYIGGPKHVIAAINKLQSQMNSHDHQLHANAGGRSAHRTTAGKETSVEEMRKVFEKRAHHMHQRLSSTAEDQVCEADGRVLLFPQRQRVLRHDGQARRRSPTASASPRHCSSSITWPWCRATTAGSTRTCGSASRPATRRSIRGSIASRSF